MSHEPQTFRASDARNRLRVARQALGKSPEEVAAAAGTPASTYYDLEDYDDDLTMAVSIGDILRICGALRISVPTLFTGKDSGVKQVPAEELVQKIEEHLRDGKISITDFEERVGFTVQPAMEDPSNVLTWNVDCLRAVCDEVSVDWLSALASVQRPGTNSGGQKRSDMLKRYGTQ